MSEGTADKRSEIEIKGGEHWSNCIFEYRKVTKSQKNTFYKIIEHQSFEIFKKLIFRISKISKIIKSDQNLTTI